MRGPSWNPLACGGTALPVPVLLAAKLAAVSLPLTGFLWQADPRAAVALGLLGLLTLLNRWPLLTVPLFGAAFLLAAATPLLRFASTAGTWIAAVPPLYALLAAGRWWKPVRTPAIWISVLAHAALLAYDPPAFLTFSCVMLAATPLLADWPREMTVIYDGDCGICEASRRVWTRIDFDRAVAWHPFQSGIGRRWSIPIDDLRRQAHFLADARISAGFAAVKRIFLFHPATYFLFLLVLAAPPEDWIWYRRIAAGLLLFLFTPLFAPIGQAAYNWVAQNRYRLSSSGACAVDPKRQA